MFKCAKPVWILGKEDEMNVQAVFKTNVKITKTTELHIAGTVFYRVYVNGKFVGFGPARTAYKHVRKDVFSLSDYVNNENTDTEIIIEAMGNHCRSLYTVFQPSCVMAEVRELDEVLSYTGKDFMAYLPNCRVQKAERYSLHRHFCEVWDYRKRKDLTDDVCQAEVIILPDTPSVLERVVPYPKYDEVDLKEASIIGTYDYDENLPYRECRYSGVIPEWWGRFEWDDIPYHPYAWLQRQKQCITEKNIALPVVLKQGDYAIFDFGQIEVGFMKLCLEVMEESDLVIGFSEYYHGDEFQLPNMDAHNIMEYMLGTDEQCELLSFEPYAFRFVMLAVKEGAVKLNNFGVKTYEYDTQNVPRPNCDNPILSDICQASIRTFSHNAVDVFSDCPSRERAGWLCDSYFTSRAEYAMTGKSVIEDAFLENFRLYTNRTDLPEGDLPEGMLPEAYPSDVRPGHEFIPQWTLWYILEVKDYVFLRGHEHMADAFRESIYGLLKFFEQYENEDGLLEGLPSRNFIEWSKANQWTKDVNYPTNFLYAKALECVYELYGDKKCKRRSEEVRQVAMSQSFNGKYFVDHAVRNAEGRLEVQKDSSETCQYYAFLLAGLDIDSEQYQYLKHLIVDVFSPNRTELLEEIAPVNAFIGAYLRMDVLLQMKEYQLLLRDVEDFFGKMAMYTGTLWENRQFAGSYDHGFASYLYVVICKALKEGKEEA